MTPRPHYDSPGEFEVWAEIDFSSSRSRHGVHRDTRCCVDWTSINDEAGFSLRTDAAQQGKSFARTVGYLPQNDAQLFHSRAISSRKHINFAILGRYSRENLRISAPKVTLVFVTKSSLTDREAQKSCENIPVTGCEWAQIPAKPFTQCIDVLVRNNPCNIALIARLKPRGLQENCLVWEFYALADRRRSATGPARREWSTTRCARRSAYTCGSVAMRWAVLIEMRRAAYRPLPARRPAFSDQRQSR